MSFTISAHISFLGAGRLLTLFMIPSGYVLTRIIVSGVRGALQDLGWRFGGRNGKGMAVFRLDSATKLLTLRCVCVMSACLLSRASHDKCPLPDLNLERSM
ncbi:hypothetical protein BO70DRAFT_186522 [Aspergillus heteromorphus CBS 117.55]|uniref:Uncharacterized protein n=1 Tax=Aspergillus heteromorphus CBS 117.55 TaxID=1448321 RepID=A0A317UXR9_9EURO|nr:uncharacterized protein BO70DRAFT_186522 [Aspergillus heteromorphus CBS 117.55]PWY65302.1 hypothetical protein BO70DRAFT_186522 [Aspergillus heteromorphus CBS 117.55]